MENKRVCSYCGESAKEPLREVWRADIEAFVWVCPDCAKEIEKVNEEYTKATAIGCVFMIMLLFLFALLMGLIYVCSN